MKKDIWPVAASPRPMFLVPPVPKPKIPILPLAVSGYNPQTEGGEEGDWSTTKPLSRTDVPWAMQRAAAKKIGTAVRLRSGKRKGKPGVSSTGRGRGEKEEAKEEAKEERVVDAMNVRPLCIKNEWVMKLDELEKRIIELSPSPSHTKN